MKLKFVFLILLSAQVLVLAQKKSKKTAVVKNMEAPAAGIIAPTTATQRLQTFENNKALQQSSLLKNLKFKNIGPSVMSGRVADIEVNEANPNEFYVAYAMGGLWHTLNNGQSFEPLFDKEATMSLGDLAVDWSSAGRVLWLGTGEPSSSRSTYAGMGVYRSADGGKTWQHMGLEESHHIGKILVDPKVSNTIWVAVAGHLYTDNAERGLYKTNDAGKTWRKVLYVNEKTSVIDVKLDPNNANTLYAASWQKDRKAWNFVESGSGSNIYKSTDGGDTWRLISGPGSGFPKGEGKGRIGLALSKASPNKVYAVLDNQDKQEEKTTKAGNGLTAEVLKNMKVEEFLALPDEQLNDYLDGKNYPLKYNALKLKEAVKTGKYTIGDIVKFSQNANDDLINTPIKGAELYVSENGGDTWAKTHEGYLDAVFNTYGYYFGTVFVASQNANKVIIPGYQIIGSDNGGKTFYALNGDNVHADHHALWINPKDENHMILGNDGGVNITYDNGKHWSFANPLALGMLYALNADMESPYNVYAGMQDNGVWVGPSTYKASNEWHSSGHYPYKELLGGDGMQIAIDTRNNTTIYTGYQFGNYFKIDRNTGKSKYMQMPEEIGQPKNRFNWQSPIAISQHNQDVLYLGGNKLFRSLDKGETWEAVSKDVTKGGKAGDVPFGTITTIAESPLKFGTLYVGTDDGLVQLSTDGGYTFKDITAGLPPNLWVSRAIASKYKEAKVYVSLSGYRNDDFSTYLYVSENAGQTWTKLGGNLAAQSINVVKEDPKNENIIYLGTDSGLFISLNGGKDFMNCTNNMPNIPVHDLMVHPRDNDLLVGTHGRSIYVAHVAPIQALADSVLSKKLYVYPLKNRDNNPNWGKIPGSKKYEKAKVEEWPIVVFAQQKQKAKFKIQNRSGYVLNEWENQLDAGLNFENYDLTINEKAQFDYNIQLNGARKYSEPAIVADKADDGKIYIRPGRYQLLIETESGEKSLTDFEIKAPEKKSKR